MMQLRSVSRLVAVWSEVKKLKRIECEMRGNYHGISDRQMLHYNGNI